MGPAQSSPSPWQRVRLLADDVPPTGIDPGRLRFDGRVCERVADSGFAMLVAWLAGPDNLVRLVDREQYWTTVTTVDGATSTTHIEPRTAADQEAVDSGIEDYLADAGVPPPPRGHRWYQRLPDGYDRLDDVYARVNAELRAADPIGDAVRPRDLVPIVRRIVATLYPRATG